jgi:hypothetical protein
MPANPSDDGVDVRVQQRFTSAERDDAVPSAARRSTRRMTSTVGTGRERSSYSLQYAHDRLQRRMGMR